MRVLDLTQLRPIIINQHCQKRRAENEYELSMSSSHVFRVDKNRASMDCEEDSGNARNGGRNRTAGSSFRGNDVEEVVVPKSQEKNFMDTLRTFSESCCASQKGVQEGEVNAKQALQAVETVKTEVDKVAESVHVECEASRKITEERMAEMKAMRKSMQDALRDILKEKREVMDEKKLVEELVEKATDQCREALRISSRVELKENFVCSYAEMVRESEVLTGYQYKRALYASILCREMASSALGALEGSLSFLRTVSSRDVKGDEQNSAYLMEEESTDGSQATREGLDRAMADLFSKVRFLRTDVDDMEWSMKILGEVGFIDDAVTMANDKNGALCLDRRQLDQKRSRILSLVRTAMPFDDDKYGSRAEYERKVVSKASRRMKLSDRHSSSLLVGVTKALK